MPPTSKSDFRAKLVAAFAVCIVTLLALMLTGAFDPEVLPRGFDNDRQLIGMNMLLILVPPYLIAAWAFADRRSPLRCVTGA